MKATAEVLKGDKVIILRYYPDGIEPVEPNPYDATVTVDCYGPVGIVKSAMEFDDALERISVGGIELKKEGIEVLNYRHHNKMRVIEL